MNGYISSQEWVVGHDPDNSTCLLLQKNSHNDMCIYGIVKQQRCVDALHKIMQ